jgi:MFS family permease
MFRNWKILCLAILASLGLAQAGLIAFVITTATATTLELSGFIVGLILLPSGLANVVGSILGGRLADLGRRKKGYGGRLMISVIGTFFNIIFNICFGFTCQLAWWYPTIFSALVAFSRVISVSGIMTFCIEQDMHHAASVTAAVNCTMFFFVSNFEQYFISVLIQS